MKKCANCASAAKYSYFSTGYCEAHLPRFLRTKTGVVAGVQAIEVPVDTIVWVPPTNEAIPLAEVFEAPGVIIPEELSETVVVKAEEKKPAAPKPKPAPRKNTKTVSKEVAPKAE